MISESTVWWVPLLGLSLLLVLVAAVLISGIARGRITMELGCGRSRMPLQDRRVEIGGIAFFFLVWGAEQIHLPVLGIAPWPWKWGLKANLTDMWHHIVYAAGATGAWALIDVVG